MRVYLINALVKLKRAAFEIDSQLQIGAKEIRNNYRNINRWFWHLIDLDTYNSPINRFLKYGHRKFPKLINDPRRKFDLAQARKRDAKANADSLPEEGTSSELLCLWVIEFYTPSHVQNLISAFENLGWDKDESGHSNPVEWLQDLRSKGGEGWFNLGLLRRLDDNGGIPFIERKIVLPEGIQYAYAHLYSLTSSLTCITVCFVFGDKYVCAYDNTIKQNYNTYFESLSKGYAILDPRSQKQRLIDGIRKEIRQNTAAWFQKHMPGIFSSISGNPFPTSEFIVLKNSPPLVEAKKEPIKLLRHLGIDNGLYNWECVDIAGLKFTWPLLRDNQNSFNAVLMIEQSNLDKIDLKQYGESSPETYTYFFNEHMAKLLTRWGCHSLLKTFECKLNQTRDSKVFQPTNSDPLKLLENLRKMVSNSIDIARISPELLASAQNDPFFMAEMPDFKIFQPYKGVSLSQEIKNNIAVTADKILTIDKAVSELLIQQGNLLSAYENIKLQRSIKRLTVFILILTVVMAYEPIRKFLPDKIIRVQVSDFDFLASK